MESWNTWQNLPTVRRSSRAAVHMSTASPLHRSLSAPAQTLKPSLTPPLNPFSKRSGFRFRCELAHFGNPRKWAVEFDSTAIPNPRPVLMASTAALTSSTRNSKKVCLFYCAETEALAERIAADSDVIELRSITWRLDLAAVWFLLQYTNFDQGFLSKLWFVLSKCSRNCMLKFQINPITREIGALTSVVSIDDDPDERGCIQIVFCFF